MKHYTKFVYEYFIHLINKHKNLSITKEQYFSMVDFVYLQKKNFPDGLKNKLVDCVSQIHALVFKGCANDKYQTFIEPVLKKLHSNQTAGGGYRNELCSTAVTCLVNDSNAFNSWEKLYGKYLASSTILLKYISEFFLNLSILYR